MKQQIQQRAQELGFDACRFTSATPPEHRESFQQWLAEGKHGEMAWLARNAHKRVDPQQVLAEAKTVVTLAVSYFDATAPPRQDHVAPTAGVVARYARFSDYHDIIWERLKQLTEFVDSMHPGTRSLYYADTGPLLERDLAQRAGLGFVGKHTNLISRHLGNWIFLSEIITTLEISPDQAEKNHCGSCTRCLSACPTAAITAPFQLDARRCISYLTIELKGAIPVDLRPQIGNRVYGCDDCLAACPWNRFARTGNLMRQHARSDLSSPELVELLSLDDAEFKRRFAGSPILRTKRRGFLRNVCVALGNVGDQTALPALKRATNDHEPLIAEHAQWAVEQIQRRCGESSARALEDEALKIGQRPAINTADGSTTAFEGTSRLTIE